MDARAVNQSYHKAERFTEAVMLCCKFNFHFGWFLYFFLLSLQFCSTCNFVHCFSFSLCEQKSDNPVVPAKKNVPNRPAPPYGNPWLYICICMCACICVYILHITSFMPSCHAGKEIPSSSISYEIEGIVISSDFVNRKVVCKDIMILKVRSMLWPRFYY